MRAFVTGGSGFVGRALLRELARRRDVAVALVRSDRAADSVAACGACAARGDLGDEGAMREAMIGCDVVFHAAAKVELWGRREDFRRDTIDGTERALRAARDAGVPRFVHVSTEAVLVGGPPLVGADETWPLPARPLGLYPWSKGRAEEAVRAAAKTGQHAVIVRPRAIWGADDTVLLPRIVERVDAGRFAWLGGGRALTSTCHVENVVAGLLAAAERGRPGEAYFVRDDDDLTFREFLGGLLARKGRDASQAPDVPLGLARFMAPLVEGAYAMFRLEGEPPVTRTAIALIGSEVTVRDDKARGELGYRPVRDRASGLAQIVP